MGLLVSSSLLITQIQKVPLVYIKDCNKLILGKCTPYPLAPKELTTLQRETYAIPKKSGLQMSISFADTQHQLCEQMLQNCLSPEN